MSVLTKRLIKGDNLGEKRTGLNRREAINLSEINLKQTIRLLRQNKLLGTK